MDEVPAPKNGAFWAPRTSYRSTELAIRDPPVQFPIRRAVVLRGTHVAHVPIYLRASRLQQWLHFPLTANLLQTGANPEYMADAWLGDFGLRVTNLERSIKFYRQFLDLEELRRVVDDESGYVLFRDRRSGQRMELNWYSEKSPFAVPYTSGEGLDHLEIRVRSVPEMLERCKRLGIPIATKKLWNRERIAQHFSNDTTLHGLMEKDVWTSPPGHPHRFNAFYIQDPDGIFLCLYDHPDEPWDGPIPDHY